MNISELLGKTLIKIEVNEKKDRIIFTDSNEQSYIMYHQQDCCEGVYIEDIIGDINDLVGNPILMAEESTSRENPQGIIKEYQDSFTWTFYKLATIKGYITIRWYGESNGYYSESVEFEKYPSEYYDKYN